MDRTLGLRAQALADCGPAGPAGEAPPSQLDVDSVARRMNDVVVRRIFAAELDLQAALGLLSNRETAGLRPVAGQPLTLGEHPAASKIWHATEELDRAIRDLRDILFEPW